MEDLDSTIWNRRRARRSNSAVSWKQLCLFAAYIGLLTSYGSATTIRPVLTQKIGFAGELTEEGPHSPNQSSSRANSSSHSNSQTSSSNNLDVTARAPLFQSRPAAGQRFFNNPRYSPLPSPSPSASSASLNYHPNHRYPDQPLDLDRDKYYVLKKQPTSSIIAETAYYSPARRLEVDDHEDVYHQKLQYGPRPSPTPVYRKIYRESPSASTLPVLTSFYTKKPTFEDIISTPHPEPKKYAFAYAVGDRHRGDDYSHRESRDGKVTMGEYKVLLPDGRLQIVRYTADAKAGFKADVTYEGEQNLDKGPTNKPYIHPKAPYYVGPSGSPDLRKRYIDSSPKPTSPIFSKYQNNNSPYSPYPSISPSIVYKGTELPQSSKVISPYKSNVGPNSITPTPFGFLKEGSNPPSPSSFPKNIYDKIASTTKSPSPYSPIPRGFPAGPSSPKPKLYNDEVNPNPTIGTRRHRKIIDVEPTKNYIPNSPPSTGGKSRLIPIEHFKAGPYTDSPKEYPKIFRIKPTPTPSHISPFNNSPPQDDHYLLIHDHHDDHHHQPSPLPFSLHKGPSPTPFDVHQSPSPSHSPFGAYPSPSPSPIPFDVHSSPSPSPTPFAFDHHRSTENYHPARNFISPTPYHSHEDSKIPPVKSSLATFTSILGGTPKPLLYIKSKPVVGVGRPVKPSVGGLVYLETPARGVRPNEFGVKEYLDRIPHEFDLQRPKTTTHPYQVGSKDYGDSVSYGIKGNKEPFIPSQEDPTDYLIPTQLNTDHFRAHHESSEHHLHNQQQFHHHHDAPEIKKVEHHHHVLVSYPEQNHH